MKVILELANGSLNWIAVIADEEDPKEAIEDIDFDPESKLVLVDCEELAISEPTE